jgi:hypothetical protein
MDKEAWLKKIRAAHSKRKGKNLEEIVGVEKATIIKEDLKQKRKLMEEVHNMQVAKYTKEGELVSIYKSQQEAAKVENIRQGDISNCIVGRQKTVKGFVWKQL